MRRHDWQFEIESVNCAVDNIFKGMWRCDYMNEINKKLNLYEKLTAEKKATIIKTFFTSNDEQFFLIFHKFYSYLQILKVIFYFNLKLNLNQGGMPLD